MQLLGTQTLEIPHGCSAQLPLFLLNTQSDYYYSEELTVRRWTLPPSKLWNPDMTIEELNKAYEAVTADIGLPSVAPIDLSIIKSLNDPLHHSNFPTLIALGICAVLLIIFIVLLILICKAYKRESRASLQPSCPPQTGVEMYPLLNVPK